MYITFLFLQVPHKDRLEWENYTQHDWEAGWYDDAIEYQKEVGLHDLDNRQQVRTDDPALDLTTGVPNYIYDVDNKALGKAVISPEEDYYLPVWQTSPVTQQAYVNQNSIHNSQGAEDCLRYHEVVFDGLQHSEPGYGSDDNPVTAEIAWLIRMNDRDPQSRYEGDIFTEAYFPVYNSFDAATRETVGVMRAVIHWQRYFRDILPETTKGLIFVLDNGCDEPYTYQIDGGSVTPLGIGDLHDTKYNKYMRLGTFADVQTISDGTEEGKAVIVQCFRHFVFHCSLETVHTFHQE